MKRSVLLLLALSLMLGAVLMAVCCASWTIGQDDHDYTAMVATHRERCPAPPFSVLCMNESATLSVYRDAIQAYEKATETPGGATYQKKDLAAARANARRLFPKP